MRSFLASKTAIRNTQAEQCTFEGLNIQCTDTLQLQGNVGCFSGSNVAYAFMSPVKITDQSKTYNDAYIAYGGCYKVELPSKTTLYRKITTDEANRYYFVSKQNAEIQLNYFNKNTTGDVVYVINQNKFSASASINTDDSVNIDDFTPDGKVLNKEITKVDNLIIAAFYASPGRENQDVSIRVTISGNNPGNIPQKFWEIKPGVYTADTSDSKNNNVLIEEVDDNDDVDGDGDGDSLSGGAIAGIVIACIVVVAVVVFCIVWFVVLKKGCSGGGNNDEVKA